MNKLYINESLCKYYRSLFGKANVLVKAKLAKNVFTRNGTVKLVMLNESTKEISHDNFFAENFPDFTFAF